MAWPTCSASCAGSSPTRCRSPGPGGWRRSRARTSRPRRGEGARSWPLSIDRRISLLECEPCLMDAPVTERQHEGSAGSPVVRIRVPVELPVSVSRVREARIGCAELVDHVQWVVARGGRQADEARWVVDRDAVPVEEAPLERHRPAGLDRVRMVVVDRAEEALEGPGA